MKTKNRINKRQLIKTNAKVLIASRAQPKSTKIQHINAITITIMSANVSMKLVKPKLLIEKLIYNA